MRKNAQISILVLIAIVHSFAFLYAWTYFGSAVLFSVGAAADSYYLSVLAATFATATIGTLPLAFLAGFIARNFIGLTVLLFTFGWVAFNLYAGDLSTFSIKARLLPLLMELLAIAAYSFVFHRLGARVGPNYAIKGTSA